MRPLELINSFIFCEESAYLPLDLYRSLTMDRINGARCKESDTWLLSQVRQSKQQLVLDFDNVVYLRIKI